MEGDIFIVIIEYKDVDDVICVIDFMNSGVMFVKVDVLFDLLDEMNFENVFGEYYFIDIVEVVCNKGLIFIVIFCDVFEIMGVNFCVYLVEVEVVF